MDLVICHTTVDFDALGAAVGVARLRPGCKIVLAGGAHPAVRDFLALHRDEYPLIERRSVDWAVVRSLTVVDTQQRDRLGPLAAWLDLPHLDTLALYDHHPDGDSDIPATERQVEPVGATTTLVVEALQRAIATGADALTCNPLVSTACLSPAEATVMALGIHVDTGSLTYEGATARDAAALAWLMGQGASVRAIAAYVDPALSPDLQPLLAQCLETVQTRTIHHYQVAWVSLELPDYVPGLSTLAGRLIDTIGSDALFLGARYGSAPSGSAQSGDAQSGDAQSGSAQSGDVQSGDAPSGDDPGGASETVERDRKTRLVIIGRSRIPHTDLSGWFGDHGGGGHARAAAVTLHQGDLQDILAELLNDFAAQIPQPPIARDLMSSPVRTIRPETTIDEARRILLRYGHSGLSVVDEDGELVGIVSRRDLDIALHHGFGHAPVKGYMSTRLQTICPDTSLAEIETRMVTYDVGRLPVIAGGKLVGIVTRTDVLRQFQRDRPDPLGDRFEDDTFETTRLLPTAVPARSDRSRAPTIPLQRFAPPLQQLLDRAAALAQERGWHLYVVGGAVRDALLGDRRSPLMPTDLDLVVDACQGRPVTEDSGAAVELGTALQTFYPDARLQVHGRFQTAALLWHNDPELGSLWADIATARTEFYPYPAANPEVEASSIRQDLYRRDFTINALAVRLTQPRPGELLDFFGGLIDLNHRQIRVLHANSFIEDPTRIYRAVRFAVRLGFVLEPQTETYIRYAIAHLPFTRSQPAATRFPALETRLKAELKIILQASYWSGAIALLDHLDALRCIHPQLRMTQVLWHQLRLMVRGWRVLGRPQPARSGPELVLWECLLETLLAALDPADRAPVATRLQLTDASIQRLATLAATETAIHAALPQCDRPSQRVDCLARYDTGTLVLVAVRQEQSPLGRSQRRHIWRYLVDWSQRRSLLDGRDLQKLGYRPGPQFKTILSDLRRATLDGDIRDRDAAIAYLHHHHPLQPNLTMPKSHR
jgi:tRNA nucleotidyltransferase (CCA-adding enzyme)